MNFKQKVYGLFKSKNTNRFKDIIFGSLKRKIRTPFIYLGGLLIAYYTFKFIYYKEINKSSINAMETKIDYLTKLSEDNNRMLKKLLNY